MAAKSTSSTKQSGNALSQIEALKAQILALEATATKEAEELNEKIQKFINSLPGQLSAITGKPVIEATKFADLINITKQVEKGTLGKLGSGERSYKSLSEDDKKNLIADRKAGMQYSALTTKYGVSSSTVFNICEAAGLTAPRAEAKK